MDQPRSLTAGIHAPELKLWHFEVLNISIIMFVHAFAMFWIAIRGEKNSREDLKNKIFI